MSSYGIAGVGYSTLITQFLLFASILVLTQLLKPIKAAVQNPFSSKSITDAVKWSKLIPYIELALPGMLFFCLEWGAFQFLILMAGYIGKNELAAQVVIYNICVLCFMIAYGVSVAASTLVGNSLGALNEKQARRYAKMIFSGSLLLNLTVVVLIYSFRWQIASAYIAQVDEESSQVY